MPPARRAGRASPLRLPAVHPSVPKGAPPLIAFAAFVAAALLSIAFRSPAALALTAACGLAYLYPYLALSLFAAAVLFALTR